MCACFCVWVSVRMYIKMYIYHMDINAYTHAYVHACIRTCIHTSSAQVRSFCAGLAGVDSVARCGGRGRRGGACITLGSLLGWCVPSQGERRQAWRWAEEAGKSCRWIREVCVACVGV